MKTIIKDDDDRHCSNDGNVSDLIEEGAKYDIGGVHQQQQNFCANTQEVPTEEDSANDDIVIICLNMTISKERHKKYIFYGDRMAIHMAIWGDPLPPLPGLTKAFCELFPFLGPMFFLGLS